MEERDLLKRKIMEIHSEKDRVELECEEKIEEINSKMNLMSRQKSKFQSKIES